MSVRAILISAADSIVNAPPPVQIAVGGGLMTTPWWVTLVQNVSFIASAIAAVCGAILGVHGVYRIWRRSRPNG